MLPVCVPVAVGSKVTLMVQVELAAMSPSQLSLSMNSGDDDAMVTGTAVAELLVRVKVSAVLVAPSPVVPKRPEVGETVSSPVPVPLRVMVCVVPDVALSVITTDPVVAPTAIGTKVILIVQDLRVPNELPQVVVSAKGPLCTTMLVIVSAVVLLVFLRFTLYVALVAPTATERKL